MWVETERLLRRPVLGRTPPLGQRHECSQVLAGVVDRPLQSGDAPEVCRTHSVTQGPPGVSAGRWSPSSGVRAAMFSQ